MALDKMVLKDKIIQEVESFGFSTEGEHSRFAEFAEAIATAVVDHIQSSAVVTVDKGSSAGGYSVE